ncbi:MAG TPA: AsmA-like C-terminal domain-containing protein, partial [Stellaceae bacterium]|nr:AsmA-like C-terminal domain-containing protein [Stellaceae bacterium]
MRRTAAQHVGHHAHRLLHWLGGVAAVLILIVGVGIWRLMQGPIELDSLTPYVQQAFERSGLGVGLAISGVRIGVDRKTHQLDLRVQDVRLSLPDGAPLANFPEMATSFSVGALLGGKLEPTRLVVEHPIVRMTRDESGTLSFRIGNAETATGDLGLDDPVGIFTPLRPDGPWKRLRWVSIRDATVVVDDRMTGRVWQADRVAASLDRSEQGVDGELSLAIVLGGNAPELHATYRYTGADQKLDLKLGLDGLDPTALVPVLPVLAPLAQARFPVSGTLGLRFDLATGRAEAARLDLGFGAGQLQTPMLTAGTLPIAHGELHADYDPSTAALRLDRLALDLTGGTHLTISGQLDGLAAQSIVAGSDLPEKLAGNLDLAVTHVPTARLDALWPRGVSNGGRRWVAANLSDGVVDELSMHLAVQLDLASFATEFSGARGTMRFHDLTVDYFNGLPPVHKVSGTATLADRRLDFAVTGGQLKALKATGGSVVITDLGAPVETLTIDVALTGPLQDALEVIDAKPLHYAHDAGLDPTRIAGKVETQLHFKLPLLDALKLDQVDYGAKATLAGAAYAKIALDKALTDGNLTLDLGRPGVHLQGTGRFDGTPTTIDANLYFHPKAGPRARYRIGLTLDDEARRRLDWDVAPDRLSGPVAVDMTYTAPASGTKAEVDAVLDLQAARLAFDEFGWTKPPRAPATAKLTAELDNDAIARLPRIDIKAAGLDGRLAATLSADRKQLDRVDIHRLAVGDNDLAGTISRRSGGGWRADIRAARLDLSHEIKRAVADDTPGSPIPLQIEARVARLALGPRREARDVVAELLRERGSWQTIKIDGRYPNGRKLALSLGSETGNRRLRFQSDDLGASLRLFGVADNVVDGHVTLEGVLFPAAGHQVLRAHVEGADYSMVRAPVLARLLSFASLEGLFSMMSGSGIPFTNLRGDFTYTQGRIALDRLFAYGGALGITAKGWISPGRDQIDVDGTLAPAYALNSVLGNVPVIGALLMGGEGQSLFAASFRLTGSSDNPGVAVNPLSALTPGILRRLFDP